MFRNEFAAKMSQINEREIYVPSRYLIKYHIMWTGYNEEDGWEPFEAMPNHLTPSYHSSSHISNILFSLIPTPHGFITSHLELAVQLLRIHNPCPCYH
jgi:hypothetical protein